MNWTNLKFNRCPACGYDLLKGLQQNALKGILKHPCGFAIGEKKMRDIINDLNSRPQEVVEKELAGVGDSAENDEMF